MAVLDTFPVMVVFQEILPSNFLQKIEFAFLKSWVLSLMLTFPPLLSVLAVIIS